MTDEEKAHLKYTAAIYSAAYGPAYQEMRDKQRKRGRDVDQLRDKVDAGIGLVIFMAGVGPFIALVIYWLITR